MGLIFNIFTDYVSRNFIPNTTNKVAIVPQFSRPKLLPKLGKLLERLSCRDAFHDLYHLCRRVFWWRFNKDMHVVFHYLHCIYGHLIFFSNTPKYLLYISRNLFIQYMLPVLRYPHQMVLQIVDGMVRSSNTHAPFITAKPSLWQVSLLRLTATCFHPASKLTGIQQAFL